MSGWTFITNHGAVLALIGTHHQITARELARAIGITERSVQRIIRDLEVEGYILKTKKGRVNIYAVDETLPLRHTIQRDMIVKDLLNVLMAAGDKSYPLPAGS